jgi:hypothetical protein
MLRSNFKEPASAEALASSSSDGESPFHELIAEREVAVTPRGDDSFVAVCSETSHPTLRGRVQITWEGEPGGARTLWAPVLAHLSLRVHDRVLVLRPRGFPEPLVVGVIDDECGRRPEPPTGVAAVLEVKLDEKVQIVAENGAPLVEVTRGAEGPVVRVMSAATRLELPGDLQITADEIVLRARQGQVKIDASADVVVAGKNIRLN